MVLRHSHRQLAQMPDGRTYHWIARALAREWWFVTLVAMFSIGLGCDLRQASRLVYTRGLDLTSSSAATSIGSRSA